jgi:hypothetical protein
MLTIIYTLLREGASLDEIEIFATQAELRDRLREILDDVAGGCPEGADVEAVFQEWQRSIDDDEETQERWEFGDYKLEVEPLPEEEDETALQLVSAHPQAEEAVALLTGEEVVICPETLSNLLGDSAPWLQELRERMRGDWIVLEGVVYIDVAPHPIKSVKIKHINYLPDKLVECFGDTGFGHALRYTDTRLIMAHDLFMELLPEACPYIP